VASIFSDFLNQHYIASCVPPPAGETAMDTGSVGQNAFSDPPSLRFATIFLYAVLILNWIYSILCFKIFLATRLDQTDPNSSLEPFLDKSNVFL
jgi:hypothetical protein